jgi:hypothetical protein
VTAAAPALAKVQKRIVVVRMADVAEAIAALSVAFALALVLFPASFPHMIVSGWQRGQLIPAMMVLSFLLDMCLYLRVAHRLSANPGAFAAACLGSLPILTLGGLAFLLERAVRYTISADLPNLQARVSEEILAHTYLGLVSSVFLPFLVIRLLQQIRSTKALPR